MVLSIHMNEYAGRSESGPRVFQGGLPGGTPACRRASGGDEHGARPSRPRSALGGDYYILTLGVPSALVECGFLSNRQEEAMLLTEDYRERVAQAVAQGVVNWAALPDDKPAPLEAVDRSDEPTG